MKTGYCQRLSIPYVNGIVITNNDTLECYVKANSAYKESISFRYQKNTKTILASVDTILFVFTDYNTYARVKADNDLGLLRVICWGRINLFEDVLFRHYKTGRHSTYTTEELIYYVEKDNQVTQMSIDKVNESIGVYFEDNPRIHSIINQMEQLDPKFLVELLNEYNNPSTK